MFHWKYYDPKRAYLVIWWYGFLVIFIGAVMKKIDFQFNFKMNSIDVILEGGGTELTQLTIEGLQLFLYAFQNVMAIIILLSFFGYISFRTYIFLKYKLFLFHVIYKSLFEHCFFRYPNKRCHTEYLDRNRC